MEKSLCDRIAERESKKINSGNSKNKVAFIALKKDIQEALDAGWSMKVIWETLLEEKKISFSYKTFRTYVTQLILSSSNVNIEPVASISKKPKDGNVSKSNTKTGIPAFTFQPTPNPEELL